MIPADHITIDGDTALVVAPSVLGIGIEWEARNRPCDNRAWIAGNEPICSDCDGTGRHTFEISLTKKVPYYSAPPTYRVHVIDVLEIRRNSNRLQPYPYIWQSPTGDHHLLMSQSEHEHITLPSAAKPGMTAVRVRIHRSAS